MMRALLFSLLLSVVMACAARAQIVRGRVMESTSGVSVGGGFVLLVTLDGKELTRTLADREGRFALRAPAPGRYRLRSERIGFRMTLSEPVDLAAGQEYQLDLDVKAVPIRLDEVRVTAGEQCKAKPEEGRATATVWEEARKALSAVAWSQRQTTVRATIRRFEREIERDLTVKSESSQTRSGYTTRPFSARSAAQLASEGYITETPDTAYMFYAPDAEVLFSDEFLNTHCFKLQAPDQANAGRLGLAFEPTGRRNLADITGVMWLDETSGELVAVEFKYVNARLPGPVDRAGGRVEFQQLTNGVWVVDYWYIRMPLFGLIDRTDMTRVRVDLGAGRRVAPSNDRGSVEVIGFREEGGEIVDVFDRDGGRLAGTAGATLSGSVFDSTRMVPLIDATVRIVGTGHTVTSGPGGAFRLDRLPEGNYQLEFQHDGYPAWGVLRPGVPVALRRGDVTEARLAVPPAPALFAQLCPGTAADSTLGAAAGTVTRLESGAAVPDAQVQVLWKKFDLHGEQSGASVMVMAASSGLQTTTDERGYFLLCGVPTNQALSAQVVRDGTTTPPMEFRVGPRELKEVNVGIGSKR